MPDVKYATALEVTAGGRLYNVVVDNEATAKKLLERGQLANRVTFIPLNKIDSRKMDARTTATAQKIAKENCHPAISLIGFEGELEPAMNYIFGDLIGKILYVFLDDIIITSSTFEAHLENLQKVFDRLREVGLKLKPNKCHFLQKEIKFLGHKVSEKGIGPDESKIEKIKAFPIPRNAKEVKSFLGLSGYYRRFIKNYATISHPLTELTNLKTHGEKTNKKLSNTYAIASRRNQFWLFQILQNHL